MKKSFLKISFIISFIICMTSGFSMAAVTGQANNPLITDNMVPVKWDGLNWVATDEFDIEWYDYENNKWANVMLKDGLRIDGVADVNTATLEDMKGKTVITAGSMFVWIPRYTYKINNNTIDVKWSRGITDNIADDFKRSPAFFYGEYLGGDTVDDGLNKNENFTNRNGTANELAGIWVAKFMAGNDNGEVTILPGYSFYKGKFNTLFELAKEIDGGIDGTSHMMKSSEWAAVAYLTEASSNSVYINNYSSEKTGFGGYSEDATASGTAYEWSSENGIYASSTNNVYGIYDLSGGIWEYVAGVMGDRDNFLSLGAVTDNFKDIDIIKSVFSYGGLAINDTKGWNSDYYTGLTSGDIIIRGGDKTLAGKAGIFAYSSAANNDSYGFRPVIVILSSEDSGSLSLIESEATVIEGDYTVVNIHFTSNSVWNVTDLKSNLANRADIRVQYTSDELITSISDVNSRIISIENLDTKEFITVESIAPAGNYLLKVEIGGIDLEGNPVFASIENSECKIIINSLLLINNSNENNIITGIDLNKVRVSIYDGSGVIPDITGIEVNPVPDRVNYPYQDNAHSDLDLTGGRINIITPGRNVTKALKEDDIAGLVQRDKSGNIIKVIIKNEELLDKLTEELKDEISSYTPIIIEDVINEFNNNTLGSFEVIVEYSGYTDTFIVNITDEFYTLNVVADPYAAVATISNGGKFEEGEIVYISFDRNIGYKFVEWKSSKAGVTIGNADSSSTYIVMPKSDVTVTADFKTIKKIEVTKEPHKTEYAKGSRLDLTGGEITITYEDGTSETKSLTSNDVTTNPYNGSVLNDLSLDKVTVSYEGKTTEFDIRVRENFTLTLKVKYPKIGTVSGAGSKEEGSQFQIRAGIYEQYYSIYRYEGCVCIDTDTGEELTIVSEKEGMTEDEIYLKLLPTENRTYPADLIMPGRNITITFNFEEPVKVTYNTDGNGSLKYAADDTTVYSSIVQEIISGGSTLEVVAEPFDGYRFVRWNDGKLTTNRFDENVTENVTYTAEFRDAYWKLVYKNCQGEIIKTVNEVRDKSEITDISSCNLEAHRTISWIYEETGENVNFNRIGKEGMTPNGNELIIKCICDVPRIIFTPETNITPATLIETNIKGVNIDNSTLEYIVNENNTEVISGDWNYTSGSFFEIENATSNGWYVANTTLSGYTGNMFRSSSNLGTYKDSNSKIIINTDRVFEKISFNYSINASDDSTIGITINGNKVLERSGNINGWQEYTGKANSIDGKIIIGLTYSKGGSSSGLDVAAIRDLRVDRSWIKIYNPTDLKVLPVVNGDNYIFARAYDNTVNRNLISAVSGVFKGINLIGDVNLDGVVDEKDYTELYNVTIFENYEEKYQLEKADVDGNGQANEKDLFALEKILDKENYYLVYSVDGETEIVLMKAPGASITLTAQENSDRTFVRWSTEGLETTLTGKTTTFEMPNNNVFVGAEFDYTKDYVLTTNLNGNVRESMLVREGDVVRLTAKENNGRVFSSWSSTGITITSKLKTIEFEMPDNDVTVIANFELPTYTLTTYIDEIEKIVDIQVGEIVTITFEATGSRGIVYFDIMGLNETMITDSAFTFTMPNNDVTVTAIVHEHDYSTVTCTEAAVCNSCGHQKQAALGHNYGEATCTQAATCSRCGATSGGAIGHNYTEATCTEASKCTRCGNVNGAELGHDYGESKCTEIPKCARCGAIGGEALGHSFTGTITCNKNGINDTVKCIRCTATQNQDCIHTYTIEAGATTNGTITLSVTTVKAGGSVTATITPNAGYSVSSVTVNGINKGAITTYIFNNITSDQTISATFVASNRAPNKPTVTVTKTTTTITFNIKGNDPDGDSLTYEIYVGSLKKETKSSTYTVTGLTHGTKYTCYVKAIDPKGLTASSEPNDVWTKCNGTGKTCTPQYCSGKCSSCDGDGYTSCVGSAPCSECGGTGKRPCSHSETYEESGGLCDAGTSGNRCNSPIIEVHCSTCSAWYAVMSCSHSFHGYGSWDEEEVDCWAEGCGFSIRGMVPALCEEHGEEGWHDVECTSCENGECSHGKTSEHRWCTHYPDGTTLPSHSYCRHGNTGEHECSW